MRLLIASFAILALSLVAAAADPVPMAPEVPHEVQRNLSAQLEDVDPDAEPELTAIVPQEMPEAAVAPHPATSSDGPRFAWGADVGTAIDMSGSEMSAFELSMALGLRWKALKFFGLGVQADVMVSNSRRSYPIYVQVRTNFRDDPSLLFWDVRGGISINYLEDNLKQTGAYFATGIGVLLARSARFGSHMILGYEFHSRTDIETEARNYIFPNLHAVTVRLGVTF